MSEPTALSVTEALGLAKQALEGIRVTVVGEVSEARDKAGWKAIYFSLSDGASRLPCMMWRNEYATQEITLADGQLVEIEGHFTVYPAKGDMQFRVRRIALAGEGVLRMQVAALARKLQDEGLLGDERKRVLPVLPERIGVVTSPRGKAVHDVIRTLRRRYPLAEVVLAGVKVEGRDAAEAIVSGIEAVDESGVDVCIVCRGGGSYEDLMPFNDEAVARAIVASRAPVVSGIGHEPDTTIADMVADVRASTPTAAAEAVAPANEELAARLRHASSGLARGLQGAAGAAGKRLHAIEVRPVFSDMFALLGPMARRLDQSADGLGRALPARLERERVRMDAAGARLRSAGVRSLERADARMCGMDDRLRALSPLGILGRGYSICFDREGRAIRRAEALTTGDVLDVRFSSGRADCTVDEIELEAT